MVQSPSWEANWYAASQEILTYSMVQSPSWEANWFAASQEIPSISRNPKVHYRTHKRPPPVSILGHPNPATPKLQHTSEQEHTTNVVIQLFLNDQLQALRLCVYTCCMGATVSCSFQSPVVTICTTRFTYLLHDAESFLSS
jgi:hypothetical protein